AQVAAVREEAHGDAGVAQQPLQLGGGRVAPGTGRLLGGVQIQRRGVGRVVREIPHQRQHGVGGRGLRGGGRARARRWAELGEGIVGGGGRRAGDAEAR